METLNWPWFADSHRELHQKLSQWLADHADLIEHDHDTDAACRRIVKALGQAGWLQFAVPAEFGGKSDRLDVRSLCIIRETLARASGLADFSFAMQGLGAGPISLFGSDDLRRKYLAESGKRRSDRSVRDIRGGRRI